MPSSNSRRRERAAAHREIKKEGMAASILQPPISSDPPLPRKRFTRVEVDQMLDSGIFAGQRFELIDGELIDKMGQKPPHANAIQRCMTMLLKIFSAELVRVQLPMEAGPVDREVSVPEPDLAVLAEAKPDFSRRHPNGRELTLLIEVSDTTVRHDATRKRDLYARAGVAEYWVIDLKGRRLIVHSGLNEEKGRYASIRSYQEDEVFAIESGTGQSVSVSALLP
jgi:Uma2 family endonuclease